MMKLSMIDISGLHLKQSRCIIQHSPAAGTAGS